MKDGELLVTFNADFSPNVLPRDRPAPVTIEIHGNVATTDGSHPPPLRRLEVALNRNGRLFTKGLPVCRPALLQSTNTEIALNRCRGALVGQGRFRAQVMLEREIPAAGKILAFNSRTNGKQSLILHFFAAAPVRFTLVAPLTIGRRKEGEFGTLLRAKIPRLVGDLGSVTEIDLKIGKRYFFAGKQRSYISAACATSPNLEIGFFPFTRATFRFKEHRKIEETLFRTCRVR